MEPCSGGGGELCTVTTCNQVREHRWRCNYTENYNRPICLNATTPQQCKVSGSVPTCPSGPAALTTASDAVYNAGYWTPARYTVYDGPQPGTLAERRNLNNYRVVMVDRKFGWNGASRDLIGTNLQDAVSKWYVVDGVTGLPAYRPDCAVLGGQDGTWCTFEQEAQNYANWFTYYRSRLFAAVGVVSEVLSNFTGPEQFMRLGYGRINNFPGALNPWNVGSIADIPYPVSVPSADDDYHRGRGLPMKVASCAACARSRSTIRRLRRSRTPSAPTSSSGCSRSMAWAPPRTAKPLHGAGLYFSRDGLRRAVGRISGEWERAADGSPLVPPQLHGAGHGRRMDTAAHDRRLHAAAPARARGGLLDAGSARCPIGFQVAQHEGPAIVGNDRLDPTIPYNYQYIPASEPHMSGGSGSTQTETLSDVLHYYWSRDLRSDPAQQAAESIPTPKNRAFWQHMSTYVVGYGVSASMDDPSAVAIVARPRSSARGAIAWPNVGLEDCRQLDDNAADAAIPNRPACTLTEVPSGNRINDTLRGALVSGGDFFSAQSPAGTAQRARVGVLGDPCRSRGGHGAGTVEFVGRCRQPDRRRADSSRTPGKATSTLTTRSRC